MHGNAAKAGLYVSTTQTKWLVRERKVKVYSDNNIYKVLQQLSEVWGKKGPKKKSCPGETAFNLGCIFFFKSS